MNATISRLFTHATNSVSTQQVKVKKTKAMSEWKKINKLKNKLEIIVDCQLVEQVS